MILEYENLRKHFASGSHRARRDGVFIHGLFELRRRAELRDCVRPFAAGLRDPSGNFAALHLDLIRPIRVVLLGSSIAERGETLLGLGGTFEVSAARGSHADGGPRDRLSPRGAFFSYFQAARFRPIAELDR